MPKGIAKGKKLIAVESELVSELNELANKFGLPFSRYVEGALKEAVRSGRMRRTLREVVEFYEVMEMRKASGYVLVPQDTWRWLIKKLWLKEKDSLREMWLGAGRWFGRLLAAKYGHEALDFFFKVLKLSEWELGEASLEEKGDVAKLRLASFTLPEENTELLMYYVEGVMESLGVKIENKECTRGIISLELKKHGS